MLRAAVVLLFLGLVVADVAKFTPCDNIPETCIIHELRITPCENSTRCILSKDEATHLAVDFTTKFAASKLEVEIYKIYVFGLQWSVGRDASACAYIRCPTKVNQKQTVEYNLNSHLTKEIPTGKHRIRVKMWDVADKRNICCFNTEINVTKAQIVKKKVNL